MQKISSDNFSFRENEYLNILIIVTWKWNIRDKIKNLEMNFGGNLIYVNQNILLRTPQKRVSKCH